MYGVPSSCALLGRFVIGAQVSLLWQHSAEREMSASACSRSMPGLKIVESERSCIEDGFGEFGAH